MGNNTSTSDPQHAARIPACLGQRVVRGSQWKWGNQDGGYGHVGTVVAVGQPPIGDDAASLCVWVVWDSGVVGHYQASRKGPCDLRLFDGGPTGVTFPGTICDACNGSDMVGTLWQCRVCADCHLCHGCYMAGCHSTEHAFLRFDAPGTEGVQVPPRQGSNRVEVHGIFVGAKVVRRTCWKRSREDGLVTEVGGTVVGLGDWGDGSVRSEVRVQWPDSIANSYCLGHAGDVDVRYSESASGGHFYADHMPHIAPVEVTSKAGTSDFCVGDRVAILMGADDFRALQSGHSCWHEEMEEAVYKIGTVQDVDSKGNIRVSFGMHVKWPIHPAALTKLPTFFPQDEVQITGDLSKLKSLQTGHGGYVKAMDACLGQTGSVFQVLPSHDLRVTVGERTWTLNPLCVTRTGRSLDGHTSGGSPCSLLAACERKREKCTVKNFVLGDASGRDPSHTASTISVQEGTRADICGLDTPARYSYGQTVKVCSDAGTVKRLQRGHGGYFDPESSLLGRVGCVAFVDPDNDLRVKFNDGQVWAFSPDCVEPADEKVEDGTIGTTHVLGDGCQYVFDYTSHTWHKIEPNEDGDGEGKTLTPLYEACLLGDESAVRTMVADGADLEESDKEGRTLLHRMVLGNDVNMVKLLLNLGAKVNAADKSERTALHAATTRHVSCVRALAECAIGLDVNVQADNGDTPLFTAVANNSLEVIDVLVNAPGANLAIQNKRGINPLHLAAMLGHNGAAHRILSREPSLADQRSAQGHTPLQFAVHCGHYRLSKTLLTQGQCTVDAELSRQTTALGVAVYGGKIHLVELLVEAGADINRPAEDGNTAMHTSLGQWLSLKMDSHYSLSTAPAIRGIVNKLLESRRPAFDPSLALACFLASRGGDLHLRNKSGVTPLQMARRFGPHAPKLLLAWKARKCDATTSNTVEPTMLR
ncbi:E3 ubiquitin-protein ligase MIB2-like isoform X1 [Haemaphysalis longicornis]